MRRILRATAWWAGALAVLFVGAFIDQPNLTLLGGILAGAASFNLADAIAEHQVERDRSAASVVEHWIAGWITQKLATARPGAERVYIELYRDEDGATHLHHLNGDFGAVITDERD